MVRHGRARARLRTPGVDRQSFRAAASPCHGDGGDGRVVDSKLKQGESGTHGARRITRRRIKSALQTLGPNETDDSSIHAARKELKKARATLRLLRDALGKTTYKRENTALRDAARPLSEARDGRVLLDALSSLIKYYGAPAANLPLSGFKRALNRRRTQARKRVLG